MKFATTARGMIAILVLAVFSMASSGCLSIGGKIVSEDTETTRRIESLESRIQQLEQTTSVPPIQ